MYSLIQHYLAAGDLETAEMYCSFLAESDKSHYNHFVWLGQISRVFRKTDVAKENFEKALRICQADENWPKDSMAKIIADIEKEIESLQAI